MSSGQLSTVAASTLELDELFSHEDQYVNWALVIIGWLIVIIVAYIQLKRANANANKLAEEHKLSENLKELFERLDSLEDAMVLFWLHPADTLDQYKLSRFAREVKQINRVIQSVKVSATKLKLKVGSKFTPRQMIDLRRLCTDVSEEDLASRPLQHNQVVVCNIRAKIKTIKDSFL